VKNEHDLGQQLVVEREQRHMVALPPEANVSVNVNVSLCDF
jgi:hypothetical protein